MLRMMAIAKKQYPEDKPNPKESNVSVVIQLARNSDFKFNFFGSAKEIFLTDLHNNSCPLTVRNFFARSDKTLKHV
jgi:hypothetical protein